MSKIEMNDTAPMNLGDRRLEFREEGRRQFPSQRTGEQNAWPIFENQGRRVESSKKARNRLDPFETPIRPRLATQQPGPQPSAHIARTRRKILDDDRAKLGLDEKNVGIAPTALIQNSSGLLQEIASVEPNRVGKPRAHPSVPRSRSQKMSTPKVRARSVPSSLLASYRSSAHRSRRAVADSFCQARSLGQSAGTSLR